ncbi:aspartyl/asparaginyl beta-hydroxylase domain-containing protein [Chromatiaceae bacterium AAb-1]|nr:aspartyl/asparaginyl beta-hydroxylase domain-containing protein [Chromatiaceae bacterium AAb-1]
MAEIILGGIILFIIAAITYVYRFRGQTRYSSFTQYLRKSWPLFAAPNCVLYMNTHQKARKPVLSSDDFAGLELLRSNWQLIRDEAQALQASHTFDNARKEGAPSYYDVGFRTFFKYGWSKYYLTWYGYNHPSAARTCPQTVALLKQIPNVKGAMFSLLPAGSQLTIHSDPLACSLRYHLGLSTPNQTSCFIDVDGQRCHWQDGEDFVFDETYPHFVRNDSDKPRLILMCDVKRPMYLPGRIFNFFYSMLGRMALVPNTEEDKRGAASALFATISPLLARSKALKTTNRRLYKTLKYTTNTLLMLVVAGMLLGVAEVFEWLLESQFTEEV